MKTNKPSWLAKPFGSSPPPTDASAAAESISRSVEILEELESGESVLAAIESGEGADKMIEDLREVATEARAELVAAISVIERRFIRSDGGQPAGTAEPAGNPEVKTIHPGLILYTEDGDPVQVLGQDEDGERVVMDSYGTVVTGLGKHTLYGSPDAGIRAAIEELESQRAALGNEVYDRKAMRHLAWANRRNRQELMDTADALCVSQRQAVDRLDILSRSGITGDALGEAIDQHGRGLRAGLVELEEFYTRLAGPPDGQLGTQKEGPGQEATALHQDLKKYTVWICKACREVAPGACYCPVTRSGITETRAALRASRRYVSGELNALLRSGIEADGLTEAFERHAADLHAHFAELDGFFYRLVDLSYRSPP